MLIKHDSLDVRPKRWSDVMRSSRGNSQEYRIWRLAFDESQCRGDDGRRATHAGTTRDQCGHSRSYEFGRRRNGNSHHGWIILGAVVQRKSATGDVPRKQNRRLIGSQVDHSPDAQRQHALHVCRVVYISNPQQVRDDRAHGWYPFIDGRVPRRKPQPTHFMLLTQCHHSNRSATIPTSVLPRKVKIPITTSQLGARDARRNRV